MRRMITRYKEVAIRHPSGPAVPCLLRVTCEVVYSSLKAWRKNSRREGSKPTTLIVQSIRKQLSVPLFLKSVIWYQKGLYSRNYFSRRERVAFLPFVALKLSIYLQWFIYLYILKSIYSFGSRKYFEPHYKKVESCANAFEKGSQVQNYRVKEI